MFHRIVFAISGVGLSIALNFGAFAQQSPTLSDADYMKQALAAGPDAVMKGAAVVRPEHDGTMRTLRQGANGFTCLIMGTDRMCADKNSMEFIHAMMSSQPPPNQIGIAYMLGGDTGPSGEAGRCEQCRSFGDREDSRQPLGSDRAAHHDLWSTGQGVGLH
jgi:hypothetical protein